MVVKTGVGELWIRRLKGRLAQLAYPGFGTCLHCYTPFGLAKPHTVFNGETLDGFFPCCEWCWQRMEIHQRMEAAKKLFLLWTKDNKGIPPEGNDSLAAMTEAVIQEWINESK